MDDESITVNRDVLKAIGADTRIDILKSLGQRQKTQSELAAELKFSVPTVLEHLQHLEKAGLVQKLDEGRKWKYYHLTSLGKKMIGKSKLNVIIVLALSLMVAFGSLLLIYQGLPTTVNSTAVTSNWVSPTSESSVSTETLMAKNAVDSQYSGATSMVAAPVREANITGESLTQETKEIQQSKSFLPELTVLAVSLVVAIFSGWYMVKD
ncbi:MAG: winged helix-turn-helix domain-containing protein [Candidatus Micrarchaeota archaeon]|nr:winged helix-turn-helix domain-containing protein [Candidatus Micrarchaeota archaeon]